MGTKKPTDTVQPCPANAKHAITVYAHRIFRNPDQTPRSEAVVKAKVELRGTGAKADLKNGAAKLDVTGVADGSYTLHLSPTDDQLSSGPAGPDLAPAQTVPFLFRPVDVTVTLQCGTLKTDPKPSVDGNPKYAMVMSVTATEIRLDWKPDWWAAKASLVRTRTADIKQIVVHHTSGSQMTGVDGWDLPAHYVINRDGHVVKVVGETYAGSHTGPSFWGGQEGLNETSVGIEQVSTDGFGQDYTDAQYDAMIDLVGALMRKYGVDKRNVVGHSAILCTSRKPNYKVLDFTLRSRDCPGQKYDWKRLEDKGLALKPVAMEIDFETVYGGYFSKYPDASLRSGDSDAAKRYGGQVRKEDFGKLVAAVQDDLKTIGFSINAGDGSKVTGVYDHATAMAVSQFQIRYLSGSRRDGRNDDARGGNVDLTTATYIQRVLADLIELE